MNDRQSRRTLPGPSNYVSLAGEFYVLAELARRRLDGTLTLGHAKEVDILILNRRTARTFQVEVKTTTGGVKNSTIFGRGFAWLMDKRHGHVQAADLIYCFVVLDRDGRHPRFFLVPSRDVAAYVRWEHPYWGRHPMRRRTGKPSRMRVFRIPTSRDAFHIPRAWRDARWRRWENNWRIFGRLPM